MIRSPRAYFALVAALSVLFVASVVYQYPLMISPLNVYDEGIIAYGSVRVMEGQLPYRDFWTQYSPAQFYVIASLFKLLGKQIMVERWWDVLMRAALALVMGGLAARLTSRLLGLLVWGLSVLWITYYGYFGYPVFQGLFFSFLSIIAFTQACAVMQEGCVTLQRRWIFCSGILLGIAALFRHDMGVYAGAAQTVVIVLHVLTQSNATLTKKLREGIGSWLVLAGAVAIVVIPVITYFLIQMPLHTLIDQLFIFPLTVFPEVRHIPYPEFGWDLKVLPYYAPFLVYALSALIAIAQLRRGHWQEKAIACGVLTLLLFGLFGWNQARVRSDLIHTVQFLLPSIILLPVLFRAGVRRLKPLGFFNSAVAASLFAALCIVPISQYAELFQASRSEEVKRLLGLSLPAGHGSIMSSDQIFAAQAVQGLTQPGDYVYVGLKNHRQVFANDVMFYFVLDRPSPTRYHELHPGLANTLSVQEEMVEDLKRYQVRYIVLTNMFDGMREDNDSAVDSGVTLLDDYIRAHFEPVYTIQRYRILKFKE